MEPKPLSGKLADPCFDHGCDGLHGAFNLDSTVGVADRLHRRRNFTPKTVAIGFANDPHAVDRQFGLPRQHRDQRIGETTPAKKYDLNSLAIMLIGQHADMDAGFQKPRQSHRCIQSGWNEFAHQRRPQFDYGIADCADIWPSVENRRFNADELGADSWQFPIGQMPGKADRGLAAFRDPIVASLRFGRVGNDIGGLFAEAFDTEFVEMSKLDRNTAEIVPHLGEYVL